MNVDDLVLSKLDPLEPGAVVLVRGAQWDDAEQAMALATSLIERRPGVSVWFLADGDEVAVLPRPPVGGDLATIRQWVAATEGRLGPHAATVENDPGDAVARAWWRDATLLLAALDERTELLRVAHVCALQGGYTSDEHLEVARIAHLLEQAQVRGAGGTARSGGDVDDESDGHQPPAPPPTEGGGS